MTALADRDARSPANAEGRLDSHRRWVLLHLRRLARRIERGDADEWVEYEAAALAEAYTELVELRRRIERERARENHR